MSLSHLSFEVLGQVGPVLAWTEGDDGSRLPPTWTTQSVPFERRERSWLLRELPNYSYDNVKEVAAGARADHRLPRPGDLPFAREPRKRPRLSPPADYDMLQALRQLNSYFFIWNGTEPCIRENRMEELHELAIRLPAGHIVRHGHARAVSEGVLRFSEALKLPELVTLLPSNSFGLRSIVRQGLSESHLHLNGVISAEEAWADNLLKPLSASAIRGETPARRRLLVLNLLAGRLLAVAIYLSLSGRQAEVGTKPRRLLELLDRIYFAREEQEQRRASQQFEKAIRRLIYGHAEDSKAAPREGRPGLIDQQISDGRRYDFLLRWIAPSAYQMRAQRDVGSTPIEGPRERYLFVHQLHLAAHLRLVQMSAREPIDEDRAGAQDPDRLGRNPRRHFLHEALFRYVVCRTHYFQTVVQQGRTTGLRYFGEYFGSRQRDLTGLSDLQYAEQVFERLHEWRGLRVLEGRVSPPDRPQKLVPWILAYARPKNRRLKKFGLVIHFKKEDESREDRGFSSRIRPPVPRLRWGRRRRMLREEGSRLYRLLQRPVPVTPFVVGIDACNLELSTPPEVFAPVFRFLRELPIQIAGNDRRFSPYSSLDHAIRNLVKDRRLGMTYHAGEDFRHLLSGLRAIHEVVEFLKPQPGDRLGHGTALALHPRDWLEHNGYQAVVPKLEWLDTLVWVHHFLGPGDDVVGELAIEDQMQRLSWQVYSDAMGGGYDPLGLKQGASRRRKTPEQGDAQAQLRGLLDWDWSPLTLWDAWLLRQIDPYSVDLRKLLEGRLELLPPRGFCEEDQRWSSIQKRVVREVNEQIGSRNAYLLLALYWMSPEVRKQGEKIIVVDMKKDRNLWLELCRRVEERMKQQIREKELVVEVNPSSNRIIGPMERYDQHHVFHLTLDQDRHLSRDVRVSVNTDNPAVCNTTLAHEYYLLGEILIGEGVAEAEVIKWLEWLRLNGEDYNFARRLKTPEDDPNMAELLTWLRTIRPTVREALTRSSKLDAFWRWNRETRFRDLGFTPEVVDAAPVALARLIALERLVREQRLSAADSSRPPQVPGDGPT